MEPYERKYLLDSLASIATSLSNLVDRVDDAVSTLTSIDNALRVQDTDNKGLADSVDEIRARLEDGVHIVAEQNGPWKVET